MAKNPIADILVKTVAELQNPRNMKRVGIKATEIVKRRTRQGFGVSRQGGVKERFKPLKPGTVTNRARLSGLSPFTRPAFSNLTATGAMLEDITPKVRRNVIEISANNPTQKDKISGHTFGIPRTKVPKRPFLALSKAEEKQVVNFVEDEFNRILEKNTRNL